MSRLVLVPVGDPIVLNWGDELSLTPGSYEAITLNSGATELRVYATSTFTASAGARLFVQDALTLQSPIVDAGSSIQSVFLGYAGSSLAL